VALRAEAIVTAGAGAGVVALAGSGVLDVEVFFRLPVFNAFTGFIIEFSFCSR
jgi:hypothetical protein